jgi:hypothetical protein
MRPPRIAILALFFAASLFLFCRSITSVARSGSVPAPATVPKSRFASFFSFSAPFTLFPPNAAISLTDDNSTSFAARPAAFGPPLPATGLSGQLWTGSGFADDSLQEGEGEGELGCSDIQGWDDGNSNPLRAAAKAMRKSDSKSSTAAGKTSNLKRSSAPNSPVGDRTPESDSRQRSKSRPVDDGTDDYLHQGLASAPKKHDNDGSSTPTHADIQSIQEAAEIAGKVVLLSRGGCGFLEKVKWAQRRGAIALIVGDNQIGGPLIQMFARGDTSNVTIPSVFTARTTAHLLASLTQPGSFIEDTIDEHGRPVLKVQQSDKGRKNRKVKQLAVATPTSVLTKATGTPKPARVQPTKKNPADDEPPHAEQPGWFARLFHWGSKPDTTADASRPPSSGRLNWVMVDDWSDEKDKMIRDSLGRATGGSTKPNSRQYSDDNFLIGVQDWRDPDLVGKDKPASLGSKDTGAPADKAVTSKQDAQASSQDPNGPRGGSITPGSGEYSAEPVSKDSRGSGSNGGDSGSSIMAKIFGDDSNTASHVDTISTSGSTLPPPTEDTLQDDNDNEGHEGLWVTITPSSSASPFFDTLLVLVISPLITLTVVYALLILRARIRRRRWRAPKSVVERLPVRTYHTVAASPTHSPRLPSPTSTSPTTPLLQQTPTRPRPRSRTTTGVESSSGHLTVSSAMQAPRSPSRSEFEKASGSISSEWKKYMGRQVECVVCLEEYVDGVSRVMSLPCGHEFHVECM